MRSLDNFDSERYAMSKAAKVSENSEFLKVELKNPRQHIRRTLADHITYFRAILDRRSDRNLIVLGQSRAGLAYYFNGYVGLDVNAADIYAEAAAALIEDGMAE